MNDYAIDIKGLTKTYKGGFTALKGINLSVEKGDFFALLGPNGAGKTTAISILVSLVMKSEGKINIAGIDVDENPALARAKIGIVPQEINLNMFETPWNTLLQQAGYYGVPRKEAKQRAEKLLKQLGLYAKGHELNRNLSGGMKRRLMIARGMIHEPEILLLDEPTAGVDVEIRQDMWTFLQEYNNAGTTILLTTHYLEEAENLCRNLAIINHGEIVKEGSVRKVLSSLEKETIVLDLISSLKEAPALQDYPCVLVEEKILEVEITHARALNDLFSLLSQKGILVESMRAKSSRLENIFMDLVTSGENAL